MKSFHKTTKMINMGMVDLQEVMQTQHSQGQRMTGEEESNIWSILYKSGPLGLLI